MGDATSAALGEVFEHLGRFSEPSGKGFPQKILDVVNRLFLKVFQPSVSPAGRLALLFSLWRLSSGQVTPAAPRPTDSSPCGCPERSWGVGVGFGDGPLGE